MLVLTHHTNDWIWDFRSRFYLFVLWHVWHHWIFSRSMHFPLDTFFLFWSLCLFLFLQCTFCIGKRYQLGQILFENGVNFILYSQSQLLQVHLLTWIFDEWKFRHMNFKFFSVTIQIPEHLDGWSNLMFLVSLIWPECSFVKEPFGHIENWLGISVDLSSFMGNNDTRCHSSAIIHYDGLLWLRTTYIRTVFFSIQRL